MCARITHYNAYPIQAEQQGEGQGITFLIRHVVIRCRDRQWGPFFSVGQTLCIKGSARDENVNLCGVNTKIVTHSGRRSQLLLSAMWCGHPSSYIGSSVDRALFYHINYILPLHKFFTIVVMQFVWVLFNTDRSLLLII